jgi:hypothetical protein
LHSARFTRTQSPVDEGPALGFFLDTFLHRVFFPRTMAIFDATPKGVFRHLPKACTWYLSGAFRLIIKSI